MAQEKLQKELAELRSEIENIDLSDTQTKTKLEKLLLDIEKELQDTGKNDNDDDETNDLIDDIKESINRFETEHPRTTAILNDIMVTLSNMGI